MDSQVSSALDPGVSERELALMPQGYGARAGEARAAAHLSLITSHPGYPFKAFRKNPLSFRLTPGLAAHRLLTFSMNSPYALVQAAAAIAANGGSIQSAELFPRSDGTLLMEINFTKAGLPQFESIEETLTRYFSSYTAPPQPAGLEAVQNLEIRHSASEQNLQTVVEIMASDSRGLLYRIARAFAALGIKVTRADIRTEGSRARDTFFVVDRQGRAPDLSGDMGHLRKEIEA